MSESEAPAPIVDTQTPSGSFDEFGLDEALRLGLKDLSYTSPTPSGTTRAFGS
jgi:hypothetical protein